MNIQYYFNYITIVEEGSLTSASRRLRVAQPALSNQVKALEEAYGTKLFYRGARRLELNDAGAVLYQKAKWMADVEASARSEILSGVLGASGTLKIGVSSSLSDDAFFSRLKFFASRYPDVTIKVVEAERSELLKILQAGAVEAVFTRTFAPENENFDVIYVKEDRVAAIYSADSPFLKDVGGDIVTLEQLADLPLAVVEYSKNAIANAFKEKDIPLYIKFSSTRIQIAELWAKAGKAVALVPQSYLTGNQFEKMRCKLLPEYVDIQMPRVSILAQKRKYRSQVVNNFLHETAEYLRLDLDSAIFASDDDSDDILF